LGILHNKETKIKMAKSRKWWCKENPDKVKASGIKCRGKKHYRWKGGSSKLNISIRTMTENRKWMDAVKERDKNCQHCESVKELESHHIISFVNLLDTNKITNRDEARECKELWDIKNGITLCRKCHYKLDNRTYYDNY